MTKRQRKRAQHDRHIATALTGQEPHWRPAECPDVPGPDADMATLREFAMLMHDRRACLPYDRVVTVCGWCLTDAPFTHRRTDEPRGAYIFCSERCAKADAIFRANRTAARTSTKATIPLTDVTTPVGTEATGETELIRQDIEPTED